MRQHTAPCSRHSCTFTSLVAWSAVATFFDAGADMLNAPAPDAAQTDIWTAGPILSAVNESGLYSDSKTYVDKPLLQHPNNVLRAFQNLPRLSNGSVDRDTLQDFLNNFFGKEGSDLDPYSPDDFTAEPPGFLPKVSNQIIRDWGAALNRLWTVLSRQENASVAAEPTRHSLLVLPYPAVVAGDRFREVYYWDSFFVIKGLLVCGMQRTAMNIVGNLAYLLRQNGFVPNGARSYYKNRSQPPLLSEMVKAIYEAVNDTSFLADHFAALEAEHSFWTRPPVQVTVTVRGKTHALARYWSTLYSPRPESFREDSATAKGLAADRQAALWHELASAAASGWDFSSRWFRDGRSLATCQTSLHLPADLNAFLYQMESNLADFATALQRPNASAYRAAAAARKEAVNTLMWNSGEGCWHDLVIDHVDSAFKVSAFHSLERTYASNWVPLWAGLADAGSQMAVAACTSLQHSGLIQAGGLLTSLYNSSQQWDAPNAWPPLQYFAIEGLNTFGDAAAKRLAAQLAQTWLEANHAGYVRSGGRMAEKYDGLSAAGGGGGGGEYKVQFGFGWTNGVALHLLQRFGWAPGTGLAGTAAIKPVDLSRCC